MCGRYRLSKPKQLIAESFDVSWDELPEWIPRYNIAPTDSVPVIRQNPKEPIRQIAMMRWGLIPAWSKDASGSARMINARSETAATQLAFRDALKSRRCLIPADGFYEWQKKGKTKQPFCFEVGEGELFAFAGIWERWKNPANGEWIKSCSVLTTIPNAVTSSIHDRMPVIIHKEDFDLWLDPDMKNVDEIIGLLKPYSGPMNSFPVSTRVNSVKNDDGECAAPIETKTNQQKQLFS
jgi:putative SOS response-associated peptidase YedK